MFQSFRESLTNWCKTRFEASPDKDSFFIIDHFLASAGVILKSKNRYARALWTGFRVALVMHYIMMARRCISIIETAQSSQVIINSIHMIFGCAILDARSLLVMFNLPHLTNVRKFLNQWKFRPNDPDARLIRQNTYRTTIWVTVLFIFNIAFQTFLIVCTSVFDSDPLKLPFEFVGMSKWEFQLLDWSYKYLFVVYACIASSDFLALFLSLTGLKGELMIAVDSFDKIADRVNDRLSKEAHSSNDGANEGLFWQFLQEELNHCIEHHGTVLRKLKAFKHLTNTSFLFLYYMTMLFIAVGVIAVMFSPAFDTFNMISVDYSVRYMIECYVFCHLVSTFNETQYQIAHKLFKLQWGVKMRYTERYARQYKQFRSTVLIVMTQSQQSLNLSCGGMFELTMEKYTSIINKSYTLTMFFWNMKNRGFSL